LFELRREKLRRKSVRVSAPQRRPAALPLILITVVLEISHATLAVLVLPRLIEDMCMEIRAHRRSFTVCSQRWC